MKIMDRIREKAENLPGCKTPVIACLGDSVTQGCFEIYRKTDGNIETVFDQKCAYHSYLSRMLATLFPRVPVQIINAGISGDTAAGGLARLDRDVLAYQPNLTVVCFGLNDSGGGPEGIGRYETALTEIFARLQQAGGEVIFMTPNMMNTEVSCHIQEETARGIAEDTVKRQNGGLFDAYIEEGRRAAAERNVPVCDVYRKWQALAACGAEVTELLSNRINHPTREMNWLFAYSLMETMVQN